MSHRPRFLLICMACGASNVTGDTTLDYDGEFISAVTCRHCGNNAADIDEMFASPAPSERPQGGTWAEAYAQAIASPAAPGHPHGEPQQPTIDETWKREPVSGRLAGDKPLEPEELAYYRLKPWKVAGVTNESVPEVNQTYGIDSQSWNTPAPSPDTPVIVRHGDSGVCVCGQPQGAPCPLAYCIRDNRCTYEYTAADLRGIGAIV